MKLLFAVAGTAITLLILDIIFLTTMISVYRTHIGELLADSVRLAPAIAFYTLYVTGIVMLAVRPALNSGQGWKRAALNGAILGLVCYGTYDLTNQATLKTWPVFLTIMDMTWGTILTATCAAAGAGLASLAPKDGP